MKKNIVCSLLLLSILLVGFASCARQEQKQEPPRAKNVIYMIGDGMALPQVFGTMLATGEDLAFCQFPYIGVVDTRSASNDITDSAAGGTALACDKKTKNGTTIQSNRGPLPFVSFSILPSASTSRAV